MPSFISSIYGRTNLRPADSAAKALKKRYSTKIPKTRPSPLKVWLTVPRSDIRRAQALGAKWDRDMKCWWIPSNQVTAHFKGWLPDRKANP